MQYAFEEGEIMEQNFPAGNYIGNNGIIPIEYQGWLFLVFVIIALGIILYGFYLISTDPRVGVVK